MKNDSNKQHEVCAKNVRLIGCAVTPAASQCNAKFLVHTAFHGPVTESQATKRNVWPTESILLFNADTKRTPSTFTQIPSGCLQKTKKKHIQAINCLVIAKLNLAFVNALFNDQQLFTYTVAITKSAELFLWHQHNCHLTICCLEEQITKLSSWLWFQKQLTEITTWLIS